APRCSPGDGRDNRDTITPMAWLPGLFVLSLTARLYVRRNSLRDALIEASLLSGATLTVLTEVLSVCGCLTRAALVAAWSGLSLCALVATVRTARRQGARDRARALRMAVRQASPTLRLMVALPTVTFVVLVLIALLAAPNTFDSMTYHMGRIPHWIQRHSVAFYPTPITRQNEMMPFAEFVILHLQLLAGSDRLANLVQTYSFGLSAVLASSIAGELRATPYAQALAAMVAASVPMAVLQGAGTQNDVVAGCLCLAFALYLLRMLAAGGARHGFYAGLALGLALLTKGTSYVYCAALGVCLSLPALLTGPRTPRRVLSTGRVLVVVLALALLLNLGHLTRNYTSHGAPLPSGGATRTAEITASGLWANVVRNGVMHMGLPSEGARQATISAVERLLGDTANHPDTTFPNTRFDIYFSSHEDATGNPIHLMLAMIALLWMGGRRGSSRQERTYAIAVGMGAILFCLLLRWQPWGTRLHTPWFLLVAPPIAHMLARGAQRWRRGAGVLATLLFLYSFPYLVAGKPRSLVPRVGRSVLTTPRVHQYFNNDPDLQAPYTSAVAAAHAVGAQTWGLVLAGNDWEYPLWALAGNEAADRAPHIRHISPDQLTSPQSTDATFEAPPPVVITTRRDVFLPEHTYALAFSHPRIRVFRRHTADD
ncbi:MAG: glycosyltransferase family 39 protein, partial [Myxococcales bacterium]|nr:glycosyltransferase family 39 protein [Myxococcales bacterium]